MVTPILDHAYPNIFQLTSNFHVYISTAKNEAFSSFCSRDIIDLKILQSDSPRAFWPISLKPDFSQVRDLSKNTATNINFLYRANSEKTSE